MILIPWMFLLLVGNGSAKLTGTEVALLVPSFALNALAAYQFR